LNTVGTNNAEDAALTPSSLANESSALVPTAVRETTGRLRPRRGRSARARKTEAMQLAQVEVGQSVTAYVPPAFLAKTVARNARTKRKASVLSLAATAFVVPGLFATVALPAYAFAPGQGVDAELSSVALEELKAADAQTVFVASTAVEPVVSREAFGATSHAELEQARIESERARIAAVYASYSGPSAADFLRNPPNPNFSLDAVYNVGLQYLGTPYRFGGANPSGFDCSGFVMFVYAQFGIGLPHSVSGQAARGTKIARADALPGDLVIMNGHDGIYAGNGNILDAPRAGGVVSVRPIWTDNYYIVRLGI
jgi:cell wall-associated NlpC family hydrolase